ANVGSANEPVPIITMRIGGLRVLSFEDRQQLFDISVGGNLALLLHPAEVALEALTRGTAGEPRDRAHHVDEQHAVEVVDLVLPGARLEIADDLLDQLALEVVGPHLDRLRPAYLLIQARKAETALLI